VGNIFLISIIILKMRKVQVLECHWLSSALNMIESYCSWQTEPHNTEEGSETKVNGELLFSLHRVRVHTVLPPLVWLAVAHFRECISKSPFITFLISRHTLTQFLEMLVLLPAGSASPFLPFPTPL
jgi:hypothetical protein